MTTTSSINCTGLSTALTALRIKQVLLATQKPSLPLRVAVDSECDRNLLIDSLGSQASAVRLV